MINLFDVPKTLVGMSSEEWGKALAKSLNGDFDFGKEHEQATYTVYVNGTCNDALDTAGVKITAKIGEEEKCKLFSASGHADWESVAEDFLYWFWYGDNEEDVQKWADISDWENAGY